MDIWFRCLTQLEEEVPPDHLLTWLKPLQPHLNGNSLVLYAPNEFIRSDVNTLYLDRIRELLHDLGGPGDVRLGVGSAPRADAQSTAHTVPAAHTAGKRKTYLTQLTNQLDPAYTFDDFVEGRSNELARATAGLVAATPGVRIRNPLLLYGSAGLGKTHLMIAAGHEMRRLHPHMRVLYLRSDTFRNAFILALRQNNMEQFKSEFQDIDALLIDDIQFFGGKGSTEEEFFHTFNELFDQGQQIVMTCDRIPRDMEKLDPRLRTRLSWGVSVLIDPPDFETRAAIMLAKAHKYNIHIPEEVAELLAQKIHSNVRELEGALSTLAAQASLSGKPITVEFALETLHDHLRAHQQAVSIPNIQKTVAQYYNLTVAALLSPSRVQSLARARQIAMALAKELTSSSLAHIGKHFNRDHSTVVNACKKIDMQMKQDGQLRNDWSVLVRKLSE